MESGADIAGFREYLASALPLSEQLTGLKFGLNPHVTDARVLPLMGAGMVSLSVGSNLVLGGDIDLPFLIFLTLAGATVHVDDHLVVDAGVLRESVGAGPTPAGAEPACAAGACPLRPGR
ncbi:MAG: hypothetical protein H0T05_00305 [Acidobacteria bacterium]|nr:hypothetical protein [Acidobacteriota bacterium]MBA3884198.1 hypothetical protein [Acidobacteriota bacterium]